MEWICLCCVWWEGIEGNGSQGNEMNFYSFILEFLRGYAIKINIINSIIMKFSTKNGGMTIPSKSFVDAYFITLINAKTYKCSQYCHILLYKTYSLPFLPIPSYQM